MSAAMVGLLLHPRSPLGLSLPAIPEWGPWWGGLEERRGQRWRGLAETRRKHELSAGECRGRLRRRCAEGPKRRMPALSPCSAPFLPAAPMGTWCGAEGPCKNGAVMPSPVRGVKGPSAQYKWHGASGSSQVPPAASSFPGVRGAASPPAPLGQGAPLGWAGESSFFLPSEQPMAGLVPWGQWKNFSAARSQGSVPAHCASPHFLP